MATKNSTLYAETSNSVSFESIILDVQKIFATGYLNDPTCSFTEVVLHGAKARGAAHRLKNSLNGDYEYIVVKDPNQEIPVSEDKKTIACVDIRGYDDVPNKLRSHALARKDLYLLIIDAEGKTISSFNYKPSYSYSVHADYFLGEEAMDIDPGIGRLVADQYANIFHAFEPDTVILPNGEEVVPYFRTSVLFDFPRSRDLIEASLCSVMRKFMPEVIASRQTIGVPPEDVRMYEFAETIGGKLGICTVPITFNGEDYEVNVDLKSREVLLLEDVVGTASTKLSLIDFLRSKEANVTDCIVLMDRLEGAKETLAAAEVDLYALTNMEVFRSLAIEQKKMSVQSWLTQEKAITKKKKSRKEKAEQKA